MPIKGSFYVITIMDAFSRAILSSDIFQSQDLSCVLIALYAAVERFGAPKKLITDNGGVFRAKQLLAICEALEIEKEYIHARQSWENLVETHFNVMRRMSQVHFEQVTSWEGAKLAHERFVTDYNAQPHWAPPQTRGQPPKPCRSVGLGHQQTPHAGTITSDFLCDALSPPLGSAGLCAFSSLETLWRRNTGSPSRSHLAAR